ncbi:hypothetical protein BJF81_09350 [Ornithinimicrobium sp. CNJ-824]|uniref:vWA domain-containing protein n=1 Tax=Ornithinimicrobium sp. CNJ-824 TaxID=1904966 RepID=UPI00095B080C|nr:vWA domain-containing protein [Ornithinimicrobium sp. CNJ-824]OLT23790.1 hypothetical protein BJF81_09350 [Ornithinimicrobium sp. CNJ-824]
MVHALRTTVAVAAAVALVPAVAHAGVDPVSYDDALDPGSSVTVTKTVTTPEIAPMPDIVLLVDRTGSMGGAIGNVKANMNAIVAAVEAQAPEAQWAVASYCDVGEPNPFLLHTDLTDDPGSATSAVDGITLCNGGDGPEDQLNALHQIGAGGEAVTFREDSSRIVVWFGDAPGHDPSLGVTETAATTSLTDVGAKVLAVSVGANQLDASGQATRITTATGGALYSGVGAGDLSATILAGLTNLPVEVGASATCDPGLEVTLDPATRTVTSGEDAVFTETIRVATDAEEGATLSCEVRFTLDGQPAGEGWTQTVTIDVNDVTAPVVACEQGPNPAGRIPASDNPDGFYRLTVGDNVDDAPLVTVEDTGSDASFGPYASGTTIKLTQAPGATPSDRAFRGEVDRQIRLKGDARIVATDAAGNTATATCEVPPTP